MPIPLAVPFVIIIGGPILYAILWRKIWKYFHGKTICIMGERFVGKSVIANFIQTGLYQEEYNRVNSERKLKVSKKFKDAKIFVKYLYDESGADDQINLWEIRLKDSDFAMYLFRADLIYGMELKDIIRYFNVDDISLKKKFKQFTIYFGMYLKDTGFPYEHPDFDINGEQFEKLSMFYDNYKKRSVRRIRDDFCQINDWIKKSPKKIVLVGTHADWIPWHEKGSMLKGRDMFDRFKDELLTKVPEISRQMANRLVIGGLDGFDETESVVIQALKLLKEN
ncbi:MAG: hypothetical protein LHW45_07820 [Candidatus Cloacimonetes bacterium]|nr:hypothetical protein [Candidatus Cloacimonadota bacterium]MDY0367518.1 hypothetical protein [Candidatus Syntrophosphaera sp.]